MGVFNRDVIIPFVNNLLHLWSTFFGANLFWGRLLDCFVSMCMVCVFMCRCVSVCVIKKLVGVFMWMHTYSHLQQPGKSVIGATWAEGAGCADISGSAQGSGHGSITLWLREAFVVELRENALLDSKIMCSWPKKIKLWDWGQKACSQFT